MLHARIAYPKREERPHPTIKREEKSAA